MFYLYWMEVSRYRKIYRKHTGLVTIQSSPANVTSATIPRPVSRYLNLLSDAFDCSRRLGHATFTSNVFVAPCNVLRNVVHQFSIELLLSPTNDFRRALLAGLVHAGVISGTGIIRSSAFHTTLHRMYKMIRIIYQYSV